MPKFKTGDLVYCPKLGNKIYKLESEMSDGREVLEVSDLPNYYYTDFNGYDEVAKNAIIFHANNKNHSLLQTLYNVDFEKPHKVSHKLPHGWNDVKIKTPSNNGDSCLMALYCENGEFWGFYDGYYDAETCVWIPDDGVNLDKEKLTVKYWHKNISLDFDLFKSMGNKDGDKPIYIEEVSTQTRDGLITVSIEEEDLFNVKNPLGLDANMTDEEIIAIYNCMLKIKELNKTDGEN